MAKGGSFLFSPLLRWWVALAIGVIALTMLFPFMTSLTKPLLENIERKQGQRTGQQDKRGAVLQLALEAAQTIKNKDERARAIVKVQTEAGYFVRALEAARTIKVPIRISALRAIASAQAESGQYVAANQTYARAMETMETMEIISSSSFPAYNWGNPRYPIREQIRDEQASVAVRAVIRGTGGNSQALAYALEAAQTIGAACRRANALSTIARVQAAVGEFAAARQTFAQALNSAHRAVSSNPQAPDTVSWCLKGIAEMQVEARDFSSALEVAGLIRNYHYSVPLLKTIAAAQAETGERAAARQTLLSALEVAEDSEWAELPIARANILATVAPALHKEGEREIAHQTFAAALEAAQTSEKEYAQANVMKAIAAGQAEIGDFSSALETAKQIGESEDRVEALSVIARAQAEAGERAAARQTFADALGTAQAIEHNYSQAEAMKAIAVGQAEIGDFSSALETAKHTSESRIVTLRAIARAQARAGERAASRQTFADALEAVQTIEKEYVQANVMKAIAIDQAEVGDFSSALKTVQNIEDGSARSSLFVAIAKTLGERAK